jgi:hypothetical protein
MNDSAMTFCDADYIRDGMSAVTEKNVAKGGRRLRRRA